MPNEDPNEIDDLEDDELEGKPEVEPTPPQDPNEPIEVQTDEAKAASRKERRLARRDEFRQATMERDKYRAEAEALRRQPQYAPPPQQQQIHPAAQKLQDIDNATLRLHKQYEAVAGAPGYDRNGAQEQEFQRQAMALQTARIAAVNEAQAPRIDEQQLMRRFAWQQFTSEHSDVFTNQQAQDWAIGRWQQLVKGEGKADTKALAEEILDAARVRFGMKPRRGGSTPTAADRQRYSGVPARAGQSQASLGNVEMGSNEKRMARIAFLGRKVNGKEMNEQQAYQHWANTVGKKLQQEKLKGG